MHSRLPCPAKDTPGQETKNMPQADSAVQAHRDAAGALVQNGKLWLVVEEAGHA